jgi:2-C-methyl-D-erythritol 4-phosphate cytidylyltransferase
MPHFAVILPAAGQSSRFGAAEKKPFADLLGRPVWLRSLDAFDQADVRQRIVVVAAEDLAAFESRFGREAAARNVDVVVGGAMRHDSVGNGLKRLRPDIDFVAVHDAARPCVTPQLIDAVFDRAAQTGAALLALPVADTVKRVDASGLIVGTTPRSGLWLAQTPQVFRRDWLEAACAARLRLGDSVTDDAQMVEALGHPVHVVPGSAANFKITTQDDLLLAAAVLSSRR